jgi:HNH endonuclease
LPSLARNNKDADKIQINFSRDAWQFSSRPPILENKIKHSGILLSQLTETIWHEMLIEAYDCLDIDKRRPKGREIQRAEQIVTLMPSGTKVEKEVSPHLGIFSTAWSTMPVNEESAKLKLQEAFARLEPFYDFVKEIIGDLKLAAINPDELIDPDVLFEGCKKTVTVNAYERNPVARKKCIEHYGAKCAVLACGFDFEKVYGHIGKGFIHVHHLTKLSDIGQGYIVDPIKDLRPVCPNCHAMLHQKNPPYSIEELILI